MTQDTPYRLQLENLVAALDIDEAQAHKEWAGILKAMRPGEIRQACLRAGIVAACAMSMTSLIWLLASGQFTAVTGIPVFAGLALAAVMVFFGILLVSLGTGEAPILAQMESAIGTLILFGGLALCANLGLPSWLSSPWLGLGLNAVIGGAAFYGVMRRLLAPDDKDVISLIEGPSPASWLEPISTSAWRVCFKSLLRGYNAGVRKELPGLPSLPAKQSSRGVYVADYLLMDAMLEDAPPAESRAHSNAWVLEAMARLETAKAEVQARHQAGTAMLVNRLS